MLPFILIDIYYCIYVSLALNHILETILKDKLIQTENGIVFLTDEKIEKNEKQNINFFFNYHLWSF